MVGKVLNGRYRLSSLLGEGGMAVVYEAEDLLLGRKVAVKVLREQFASDAGFLARFQREARAAAGLSHPNIVAIYDVGSEDGTQYIVMELVAGRTLKEIIQQEAPLSVARIIGLGRQLCEGLEYAHQHRIVHRDVKPHNLLVAADGRAKIADFGIAVALGASALTQSGYIVGTAHYLSPEQARGEPTTAYSDLYSAGVVLYEMATGRLPFEGETSVVVALKQIQEEPVPPRRLNPRIPESLQSLILRALAKAPGERFASGAEMGTALADCARLGLEATQAHQLDLPGPPRMEKAAPPARAEGTAPRGRVERAVPPEQLERPVALPEPTRSREGRNGSSGWLVLMVVFAAFLCTLGAIPLGILAYSNGTLGRYFPGLVARAAPSSTPLPVPVVVPTPEPTPQPTRTPTSVPTPTPTATPTPIQVPGLVGVPFPTARQQAQSMGLDLVIAGEAYDTRYPVAAVVSQKPEAGTRVEKGTRIEVVVSLGREILAVPRVVGDTAAIAQGKLQAAGFTSRLVEETNDRVPAGVVIAQNPAPETSSDRGAEVVLTVSAGREKVAVPGLVGLPEADAQEAIARAGLAKTWVNYQDFPYVPPGHVLSQEPKPGIMVEKGTTVYIAVRRPQPAGPTPAPPAPTAQPPAPTPTRPPPSPTSRRRD